MRFQQRTDNNKFFVSTVKNPITSGWETMVFPITPDGAIDFVELDYETYEVQVDAESGHKVMLEHWNNLSSTQLQQIQEKLSKRFDLTPMDAELQ